MENIMNNSKSDSRVDVQGIEQPSSTNSPAKPAKDPIRFSQHELRTPLNHILGFSELLIEEIRTTDSSVLSDGLKKINEAGNFILARITETFSFTGGPHWTDGL